MINVEKEIAGKTLNIQTGKIARQSAGSVVLTYGDTTLLVAVNAAKEAREDIGYFPLQVEYREKHYASGKIPGGFFKREARPTEGEVLTSRLTDRPIRPLFPKGFKNETQVMITVLQSDGENMADTWAGVGASAALMISNIPWHGPIATVRVGKIDNDFVLNPTRLQLEDCSLELVVSGNNENIVMVEGEADEVSEPIVVDALKFAQSHIVEIISLQEQLVSSVTISKLEEPVAEHDQALVDAVNSKVVKQISDIVKIVDKQDRDIKKTELVSEVLLSLEEDHPEKEKEIKSIIDDINSILKVTKISPKKITIYTAEQWKSKAYNSILKNVLDGQTNIGTIIKSLIANKETEQIKKDPDFVKKTLNDILSEPVELRKGRMDIGQIDEKQIISSELSSLVKNDYNVELSVFSESDSEKHDPKNKAKAARPFKPAILIE